MISLVFEKINRGNKKKIHQISAKIAHDSAQFLNFLLTNTYSKIMYPFIGTYAGLKLLKSMFTFLLTSTCEIFCLSNRIFIGTKYIQNPKYNVSIHSLGYTKIDQSILLRCSPFCFKKMIIHS